MLKIGLYIHLSASFCGCALLHVSPPILYLRPSISSLRFVLLRNCWLFLVFHFPLLLVGIKYSIGVLLWKKIFWRFNYMTISTKWKGGLKRSKSQIGESSTFLVWHKPNQPFANAINFFSSSGLKAQKEIEITSIKITKMFLNFEQI